MPSGRIGNLEQNVYDVQECICGLLLDDNISVRLALCVLILYRKGFLSKEWHHKSVTIG